MYKNLPKQMVLQLKDLVQYQPGQVVSRTLVQNDRVSMTLFSFDQGEEISAHASGGDAMVTVLEGRGRESWACRCLPRGRKQSHGSLPMEDMRETLGSISKDSLSGFESTECSITMNPHTSVMYYYSRESCGQGYVLTLPMEGQP